MACGVLGFGGIGDRHRAADARLRHAHPCHPAAAAQRPGPVDWIGTPDQLDELLAAVDVLVISLPLTRATRGMIGARELGLMKPDAILVNLARGEMVDEAALYDAPPARIRDFTACIDAWWVEPVRHGEFPHGPAVHATAERDRLAAQLGVDPRLARSRAATCRGGIAAACWKGSRRSISSARMSGNRRPISSAAPPAPSPRSPRAGASGR